MRTLKYYDDSIQAHIDCQLLESEGIRAMVLNENTSTVLPYSASIASLRPYLVVSDRNAILAAELLELTVPAPATIICPHCGSAKTAFGMGGKSPFKRALIWFVFLPLALFAANPLGRIGGRHYCRDCRQEFNKA